MRRRRGVPDAGHKAIALVEMIIAIGALAAVSIVVMQLFVRATQWENRARDLDRACFEAQSIIERYRLSGAPKDGPADGQREIYYDSDWRPLEEKPEKGFVLSVSPPDTPDEERRLPSVTVIRLDPTLDSPGFETVFPVPDDR